MDSESYIASKKLLESNSWVDIMSIAGDKDMDGEFMIEMGEKFYLELYGKLRKKTDSLYRLFDIMYTKSIYIPISRMSLTSRVFRFHMLRAY